MSILKDIAKDAKVKSFTREKAVKVMGKIGSKNDLKQLKTNISKNAADKDEIDINL